jgi:hypothetical protein
VILGRFTPTRRTFTLFAIFATSFIVAASALGGELQALCSAARNLVNAGKAQAGVLVNHPRPSDLAASTRTYAAAKKRYVAELRPVMPIFVAISLKQRPENAEVEEFRSIFQQFGGDDEEQVDKATLEMLKRFENDQAVATAEKEFKQAQEIEADFLKEYVGLNAS